MLYSKNGVFLLRKGMHEDQGQRYYSMIYRLQPLSDRNFVTVAKVAAAKWVCRPTYD
jgi:hypothetical protein